MNTTTLNGLNCPCVLSLDDEYKLVFCLGHLGKQIQMSPSCALHNALKEEVILATLQSHFLWKTEMFLYKHVSENEVEGGTCSFPLFLFCHWTIITEILSFLLKKSQKKKTYYTVKCQQPVSRPVQKHLRYHQMISFSPFWKC